MLTKTTVTAVRAERSTSKLKIKIITHVVACIKLSYTSTKLFKTITSGMLVEMQ